LLIHHISDLVKPGWENVVDGLMEAKARGWVRRIGASVYGVEDLALVESRFTPELVQLPLNVLDRRLFNGNQLVRLKKLNIEIHARSVFLQGLLLMPENDLPGYFAPVRAQLANVLQQWSRQHVSALAGCLAFVLQQPEIDVVIIGLNRCSELEEIVAAVMGLVGRTIEFGPSPSVDPIYLDPSRWPAFPH
jgi:aryl-alcohol dehydrogenase-like predicted oxidoreductase